MLRTFWAALVALAATIPAATAVMVVAVFHSSARVIDAIIRLWARTIVRAAGIDLQGENMDLIQPDKRYILIANHYSYLDIPCIFACVPQPIRFFAKISLFKIPVFGWALGKAGFIPIDRKNRRTAVKSFDLAGERIRKGNTIVIFPEEGRSRQRTMREFQRGAFLLAIRSGVPIVPVAVDGTYDVFPARRWSIKPGRVTIRVTPPIATEGMSVRDKEKLLLESRARIHKLLFGTEEMTPPAE